MPNIAFITKFGWVGISTSVINSAIFWESKGYTVDIYSEKPDEIRFPLPKFSEKNIKFIITEINKKLLINDIFFRIKYFRKKEYEWVIGFDHSGLIRGGISSLFTKNKLIYHSLEFFEPRSGVLKDKLLKIIEKSFAKNSIYIFTQGKIRAEYISKDLNVDLKKIQIIYNSPIGEILEETSEYFRTKFNISAQQKIILCIGSLIKETFVCKLVEALRNIDKEFVLVFHGWFSDKSMRDYLMKKGNESNRVFISDKLFNDDEKYIPYQSCDIGFVGYDPITNNLKFAAEAAGKIFDFLRTRKPIICYLSPGMKEIIDENEVGSSFTDFNLINESLLNICSNYNTYSNNCKKVFNKYEFKRQYENIFQSLIENN